MRSRKRSVSVSGIPAGAFLSRVDLDILKGKHINEYPDHDYKWYEENRPEHVAFVKEYENEQCVIIQAEPKSGKRDLKMIETSRRKKLSINSNIVSTFLMITSLHRKDNKEQFEQMEEMAIKCFTVSKNKEIEKILDHIKQIYRQKKISEITIFVDESDYGTGKSQIMAKLFQAVYDLVEKLQKDNNHKKIVYLRYYSASNEEALNSAYGKKDCKFFKMTPPQIFQGSNWYLDNNLVHESEHFFGFDSEGHIVPSLQAKIILDDFLKSPKPFGVLRVASKDKSAPNFSEIKNSENVREWLRKVYGIRVVIVDQNESMNWGYQQNSTSKTWSDYDLSMKRIFLINQTCTRSTEVGFHPLIHFWHDHRGLETPYNTIIQAALRVSHYPYKKNEFWPEPDTRIQLYTCKACISYMAGKLTMDELRTIRPISQRISSKAKTKFMPSEKMMLERKIDFIPIPQDVLESIDKEKQKLKTSQKNSKKGPRWSGSELRKWALSTEKIIKNKEQYDQVTVDRSQFLRTLSHNKRQNMAKELLELSAHAILAPVYCDGPSDLYVEDWYRLLAFYEAKGIKVQNCMAVVTISDEELNARRNFKKEYLEMRTTNSMYGNDSIQKLSK